MEMIRTKYEEIDVYMMTMMMMEICTWNIKTMAIAEEKDNVVHENQKHHMGFYTPKFRSGLKKS